MTISAYRCKLLTCAFIVCGGFVYWQAADSYYTQWSTQDKQDIVRTSHSRQTHVTIQTMNVNTKSTQGYSNSQQDIMMKVIHTTIQQETVVHNFLNCNTSHILDAPVPTFIPNIGNHCFWDKAKTSR